MMTSHFLRCAIVLGALLGGCSSSGGMGDDGTGDDGNAAVDAAVSRCGNGVCDPGETESTCSADCHSLCGNHVCDPGETTATCAGDCPAAVCSPADPSSCTGET